MWLMGTAVCIAWVICLSSGRSVWAQEEKPETIRLFDGKSLDGWMVKCRPQDNDKRGYWKVVDGTITAEVPEGSKHHYIWL
ncbi:MAG: hypothetical protein D6741_10075, partial [Planctomycetota bacterium]